MISMEYVELQGQEIPALGLGTWQMKGEECRKAVENALEVGYRHIDTAQAYGNEGQVGAALQNSDVDRDEVWLTTKLWRSNFRSSDVTSSFRNSLEKLRTDYVDLLLIHWPSRSVPFEETLNAMAELADEGAVRNIGISNFTVAQIEEAVEVSPREILTNQVEYHPFLDQTEVLEKCRQEEMMLTAYSPLARGEVLQDSALEKIGKRYNKSPAQVALRWLVQQENVAAIPKASKPEHQEANIDIFDFELESQEMETVSGLKGNRRLVNPGFAPDWD